MSSGFTESHDAEDIGAVASNATAPVSPREDTVTHGSGPDSYAIIFRSVSQS